MPLDHGVATVDLSTKVSFVVRLEGSEWTTTEVLRTLAGVGGLELVEVRVNGAVEELAISGRPVAVAAAMRLLAVEPADRVRVLSRLHAAFGISLVD